MVTFEDVTDMFLEAAEATGLSIHPEIWMNSQTLEREFACTLHPGPCEEADHHATCTVAVAWGPLDTVLSMEGAAGICEFFHEPDESCPHLHTEDVPPLALDLTYALPLTDVRYQLADLQTLARTLKLRASEHSSRAVETRPSIALSFGESGLELDGLTLQQRVELPLWDPEGVSGFRPNGERRSGHLSLSRLHRHDEDDNEGDEPHPEDWLPHLLTEALADIVRVIDALESVAAGRFSSSPEPNLDN